ncbi:MAG: fold metallo-hydrolase [Thermoleophilia bacterium]|nr:fold metallo-hydrolase [Thermoleophilia bacterium]
MQLYRDVARGIHRIEDAYVNFYVVEADGRACIVDAGHPRSWESLHSALDELGIAPSRVDALILTHAHFDHVGFAERARTELGVPVWVHEADESLAAEPWDYEHERSRLPYAAKHPSFDVAFAAMGAKGALTVKGVETVRTFTDGQVLDVPGAPTVVHVPGHTYGEVAFHYPDRDALIVGDAIVTHDPYTNGDGPRIVAGAATADSEQALASLDALVATGATRLLVGHGDPWTDGVASAVAHAREVGAT